MSSEAIMKVDKISKSFSSTKALSNVTFEIGKGEIRGLIGENGSGKSTLASIISGIIRADSGDMIFEGKKYKPLNSVDAKENGIAMVMQEIGTIAGISVAANIFVGREKQFSRYGFLNYKKMNYLAKQELERIKAGNIDPSVLVDSLNLEERKIVEIAKAIMNTTKLLIIDETSNALTKSGRDVLYSSINDIKANGGSVIFITHDLHELVDICDSVTILRDGVYIDTLYGEEMKIKKLKELMVGREMSENYYRSDFNSSFSDEVSLNVDNISTSVLNHISFELYKGEILGIGGLADCGMHEIGRVLFGLDEAVSGFITVSDSGQNVTKPKHAIKNSIGYISKNRDTEALVLACSIKDNVCIAALDKLSKMGIILKKSEKIFVKELADKLDIKMRDINQYAAHLSGGNKQKVVLAKWLGNGSKILIMDCPTRGIDIGVKEAIYKLMEDLKEQGHSMIMISEELPELIGMSDRMIIMKNGEISGTFDRSKDITEDMLIHYMI